MNVSVWSRLGVVLVAVSIALAGFGEGAFANARDRYQEQLQQFKTMLEEQSQEDTKKVAEKDIALVQKWLQEAEVLLANGDYDATGRRMRRVEYGLDLVRALVASAKIDTLAEQQEAYYYTSRQRIEEFEKEIEGLQRRKQDLNEELQKLR